jgi:hypothetical protein
MLVHYQWSCADALVTLPMWTRLLKHRNPIHTKGRPVHRSARQAVQQPQRDGSPMSGDATKWTCWFMARFQKGRDTLRAVSALQITFIFPSLIPILRLAFPRISPIIPHYRIIAGKDSLFQHISLYFLHKRIVNITQFPAWCNWFSHSSVNLSMQREHVPRWCPTCCRSPQHRTPRTLSLDVNYFHPSNQILGYRLPCPKVCLTDYQR